MTLFVLAAGLGSRYGGLKQIDPMTPHGEFIIDFSVHDAIRAGFDRVVFIIKKENYELFRETIGARIESKIKVEYAFQSIEQYVKPEQLPKDRTKPWGTFHALLCAKEYLKEPFAIINADDFYGADAYRVVAEFLRKASSKTENHTFAMVGYRLGNTLTDAGSVARGVCQTKNGKLISIVENTTIFKTEGGGKSVGVAGDETFIPEDTPVSMNFWGFTPEVFEHAETYFARFLADETRDPLKSECYLPNVVGQMIVDGTCDVEVLKTDAQWYGVTYQEDKSNVIAQIQNMIADGTYPNGLWK